MDMEEKEEEQVMSDDILPELRPYLEDILDEALARGGMTMRKGRRREHVLHWLHKQFERFMVYRLLMAMPLTARQHFAFLIENDATDEELKAFARKHILDIPVLVSQVFVDFRERFVKPGQKHRT